MFKLRLFTAIAFATWMMISSAGCAALNLLRIDPCPTCHLSLSDLSGLYAKDGGDSCLYDFTGDAAMLPDFDEVLAEIEVDLAQNPGLCQNNGTSSPTLSTGVCQAGGYPYISLVSGQFQAATYYFDPTTKQLVGITQYGDFGVCGPNTYYISRIECGEETQDMAICP